MIDDNSGKINVIFGSERNQRDFKSIALVVLVGGDKQGTNHIWQEVLCKLRRKMG